MKKNRILVLSALLLSSISSFSQHFVSTGTSKYVLLEVATSAWGGFCPDAQQNVRQSIIPPSIPTSIVINWHPGASVPDTMGIPGDPFCTGTGYISG